MNEKQELRLRAAESAQRALERAADVLPRHARWLLEDAVEAAFAAARSEVGAGELDAAGRKAHHACNIILEAYEGLGERDGDLALAAASVAKGATRPDPEEAAYLAALWENYAD